MAALGAIGINNGTMPTLAYLYGSPWWYSPLNRAIGVKNQDSQGPMPSPGGFFGGGTPVFNVPGIIANYGQSGGGITIF